MTIATSTKIFLVVFTSCLCSAISQFSSHEKDYYDSAEDDDAITAESYPMGVVAPLIPPPYGHRSNVPYNPSVYGTSSTYHEQDYGGYGSYRFGYKVEDPYTGNYQSRDEEKDDYGAVKGSYSLVEPDGNIRTVYYIADKYGYRAYVKNSHKPSSSHGLPPPF
uniref:Uncharacterized protein n=1 Tax=Strigamia maritima TaxID=126957 RepID=T1IUF9_STRMM